MERRVVEFDLGGQEVVALAKPGTASALDASAIPEGRDVGATGVFVAEANDRPLTFRPSGESFQDEETGSTWNILGEATAGPLAGAQLEGIQHIDTFWFAWQAFHTDTAVVGSD